MPLSTVLFDLDNTIYPASSGLMKGIDSRINEYVKNLLDLDDARALQLRKQYYVEYGTTLHGLQLHHRVDPDDYLAFVHDVAIEAFLASDAELDHLLSELRAGKAIFTNAPASYARRVLAVLGIERHFSHVFDIHYSGLRPKPDPAAYQAVLGALGIEGSAAMLVEDTAKNLPPARALGMTTVLVGEADERAAALADYVVPDVLAATRLAIELERAGHAGAPAQ
ncbi:pyrimidine 5'-nucleotidase [Kouleothrix sp.]|uniref:pyrimidine 5'-nucleotidase n=1 Tax=Kouleothrix sp. TaxID=2779161 RepID=UPI003919EFF5